MAIIRRYIESGKPLVGIRTACHAFDTRGKAPAGHAEWKSFDPDVLGGPLHRASSPTTLNPVIDAAPERQDPSDPRGSRDAVHQPGLALQDQPAGRRYAVPLLMGTIPGQPPEPVAWVNSQGHVAGLLHVAGPPRRFRDRLVPQAAPQRRVLGTRPASRRRRPRPGAAGTKVRGRRGGDTLPF